MKLDTQGMTGTEAWELARWCGETAETLRDYCLASDNAARRWWSEECRRPTGLVCMPRPREDMYSFAERLQAEGYEWAGEAGSLYAVERGMEATVVVDRFVPADEEDGPFEGEELMAGSPAVSLRFDYDAELIEFLKSSFRSARHARSGRGRPYSRILQAGGWSGKSRCWWVRSTYWIEVRKALLEKGVALTGPLAHPKKVKRGFFLVKEQSWDAKRCAWC